MKRSKKPSLAGRRAFCHGYPDVDLPTRTPIKTEIGAFPPSIDPAGLDPASAARAGRLKSALVALGDGADLNADV